MKDGIDTSLFFCPNEECDNYGEVGSNNQIICWGTYGKSNTQLLYCKVCKRTFSSRRGTPLFNLKAGEETFYRALACLAEGNSIRATARIMGLDKDTVCRWLEKASKHVEAVSLYLMKNLHLTEAQLDELWSFVKKKRRTLRQSKRSLANMGMSGFGQVSTLYTSSSQPS